MDSTCCNAAYYRLEDIVDPTTPFSLTATARVLPGSGQTLAFYVAAAGEYAAINISPTAILDETNAAILINQDNTIFHEYRMVGSFGTEYQLFVDGVAVAVGSFAAYGPNLLAIGDSGGFGSGQAEVTSFSFLQPPPVAEPSSVILLTGGLACIAATTIRRRRARDA